MKATIVGFLLSSRTERSFNVLKISASEKHIEMQNLGRIWGVRNVYVTTCILNSSSGKEPLCEPGCPGRGRGRANLAMFFWAGNQEVPCITLISWSQNQVKTKEDTAINNDLFHVWVLTAAVALSVQYMAPRSCFSCMLVILLHPYCKGITEFVSGLGQLFQLFPLIETFI